MKREIMTSEGILSEATRSSQSIPTNNVSVFFLFYSSPLTSFQNRVCLSMWMHYSVANTSYTVLVQHADSI